uniref:Reverse transcriptase zinc-binding domain-containing protein n=1 Tax=Cannabis sativa TaxID=3483 RepID=A0A803P2Y9_CANSA
MSIQLSNTAEVDSWFWAKETSGIFTVKSAYKHLQLVKGEFPIVVERDGWNKLWQLHIPPKVHDFLWRSISGYLPTKAQLHTKHVYVDLMCPLCHMAVETIFHVLVDCRFARSCWNLSILSAATGVEQSFSSWFFSLLETKPATICLEAAMVSWGVWKARNVVF